MTVLPPEHCRLNLCIPHQILIAFFRYLGEMLVEICRETKNFLRSQRKLERLKDGRHCVLTLYHKPQQ